MHLNSQSDCFESVFVLVNSGTKGPGRSQSLQGQRSPKTIRGPTVSCVVEFAKQSDERSWPSKRFLLFTWKKYLMFENLEGITLSRNSRDFAT